MTLALASHSLEKEIPPLPGMGMAALCTPTQSRQQTRSFCVLWSCCRPELKSKLMFHPSQLRAYSSHPLPPTKSGRCSFEPPSMCLLPDCDNVMLHWPPLPGGPLLPGRFRGLVVGSCHKVTTGKVGTQHGPLAMPRERGQAVAALGLLLIAGVIWAVLL